MSCDTYVLTFIRNHTATYNKCRIYTLGKIGIATVYLGRWPQDKGNSRSTLFQHFYLTIVQHAQAYRQFTCTIHRSQSVHASHTHIFQLQPPMHYQGLKYTAIILILRTSFHSGVAKLHFTIHIFNVSETLASSLLRCMDGTRNSIEAIVFAKVFVDQPVG